MGLSKIYKEQLEYIEENKNLYGSPDDFIISHAKKVVDRQYVEDYMNDLPTDVLADYFYGTYELITTYPDNSYVVSGGKIFKVVSSSDYYKTIKLNDGSDTLIDKTFTDITRVATQMESVYYETWAEGKRPYGQLRFDDIVLDKAVNIVGRITDILPDGVTINYQAINGDMTISSTDVSNIKIMFRKEDYVDLDMSLVNDIPTDPPPEGV